MTNIKKDSEKSLSLLVKTRRSKMRFCFTFKRATEEGGHTKPEAWKINQENKCEFHIASLYCLLAMLRLALIITDPLLLFRNSQLLLLPLKPLIWIGVKLALIADPYHHQAHHPGNSVCSLRFVNWLLCYPSLNWCLESGSLSLQKKKRRRRKKKTLIKSNGNLI